MTFAVSCCGPVCETVTTTYQVVTSKVKTQLLVCRAEETEGRAWRECLQQNAAKNVAWRPDQDMKSQLKSR